MDKHSTKGFDDIDFEDIDFSELDLDELEDIALSLDDSEKKTVSNIPVLPLRGLVVFPDSIVHFDAARTSSVAAIRAAMKSDQLMFVTAQKDPLLGKPTADDLYKVGTIVKILQMVAQPEGNLRIIVEGQNRAVLKSIDREKPYLVGTVESICTSKEEPDIDDVALMRSVKELFAKYVELTPKIPGDIMFKIGMCREPGKLSDYVAGTLITDFEIKQNILSVLNDSIRLMEIYDLLENEVAIAGLQNLIYKRAHENMDEHQKEYFLREQIRAIREELGEEEDIDEDVDTYLAKIRSMRLSDEVTEHLKRECSRLRRLPESSQEAFVIRMYLDTCLELPWNKSSKDKIDISAVTRALDKNHFGLDKVKERILEYLAVRKLKPEVKGQIICLVGPPGVGKTSIAQSIASAIHRKSERIALGGVHDEAEIRGHRRTYIAAMPGRIISAIKSAGTNNPVLILDEIDKLASDYKGDPTSALLEVLDPEQNSTFRDHYIDLPFDLSKVMFITTANDASMIPAPLMDRMEIIEIGSYTREEKLNIAKKHLIPKQLKNNALTAKNFKLANSAIYDLIDSYTREAGVRTLERKIASLMRKAAKNIADCEGEAGVFKVDSKNIEQYLGPRKYKNDQLPDKNEIGLVNGLAWTSVGGETLPIEVAVVPGTGKIELTGSLGDVMQESAKAALTCVRTRAENLGIDKDFYKNNDIHIHAPEGAVPKDGPSAGITMTTAIVSALTKRPVNRFVAMTGEITLRGRVLPIGGLKEKSMGAYKMGIQTIIIPKANEADLYEVDDVVKENVKIVPVETIDEVFEIAFADSQKSDKPAARVKPARKSKATSPVANV